MCAASRGGGVWGYLVFESGGRYLDDRAAIGGGPSTDRGLVRGDMDGILVNHQRLGGSWEGALSRIWG